MDITEFILNDHMQQRRMFAMLDDIDRSNTEALSAIWQRLAVLLEVHAEAEEKLFYPHLLKIGTGAGTADSVVDEVEDAIADHNEIRDAVRAVAGHSAGSDEWWDAVVVARKANDDHMAEEEREDLPDFRHHASLQLRHDIAVAFATYEAQHSAGTTPIDRDPATYIAENS